jgi:DNA polymerase-3 subunit delta
MKIANNAIDSYINKISDEKIAGAVLFGFDDSLISYRGDIIAKKIVNDLSDSFSVANISKEQIRADQATIIDEFSSFAMLGGRKLIMIRDVDSFTANLVALALNNLFSQSASLLKNNDNFILIIAGDLDKNSPLRKLSENTPHLAAIACYEDDDRTSRAFIQSKLLEFNLIYDQEIIDYLLEKFDHNRFIIISELEKISLFLGDQKSTKLTTEVIDQVALSSETISTSDLVNNFAAQNFKSSLISAEKLFKDGFEAITLIRFLTNYLQKLYICKINIKRGTDFETEVKSQRLFFKQEIEFRKHLKTATFNFLITNLKTLNELEIAVKTTNISGKILFSNFICSLDNL